jgi:hypothetical protein
VRCLRAFAADEGQFLAHLTAKASPSSAGRILPPPPGTTRAAGIMKQAPEQDQINVLMICEHMRHLSREMRDVPRLLVTAVFP